MIVTGYPVTWNSDVTKYINIAHKNGETLRMGETGIFLIGGTT